MLRVIIIDKLYTYEFTKDHVLPVREVKYKELLFHRKCTHNT